MSTQAASAYGTILKSGATEIAELTSISGPAQKSKAIDVTNMDSPNAFAEYIVGVIDGGQIQIEGNWTGVAAQTQALTDFQARTLDTFTITLPTGHSWSAPGYWVDISHDFKVDDRITFKATIQVTGKPTFA